MKTLNIKILIIAIAFFTSCSNEDEVSNFESIKVSKTTYNKIESEILLLVNNHRVNNGLKKLNRLDIVSSVALTHSKHMAETKMVSHDNFPMRVEKLKKGVKAKRVGENIAFGYKSAKATLNAWLNSHEHKEVLENPGYTHFGVSSEMDDEGKYYFTQIFIKK